MTDEEMARLKSRIDTLQIVYFALFIGSLAMLAYPYVGGRTTSETTMLWVVFLGGAVATRLYRNTQVNRYNSNITGKMQ